MPYQISKDPAGISLLASNLITLILAFLQNCFIFEIIFLLITLDPNTFKTRLISPLDYDERYVYPCAINGGDTGIWCASFYGECGYHYFPCHAWGTENVFLYGENFGDGFYIKMSKETP